MKHAIIILAHKNVEQLCHLVEYFSRDCYVFIHLDTKFRLSHDERERLRAFPQVVKVCQRFNVHWGGYSILRCEMYMLREVLRRCDAEYVHLISGQDYPMKPLDEFLLFFEQHRDKDCMQYIHLPHMRWERNTFIRFCYFHPYDWFTDRTQAMTKIRQFVELQRRWGIKRSIPNKFDHLYGNSQWFSITRASTQMLVDYTRRHPWLYWRMWMTFAPEESYIATVLVNLKGAKDVLFTNFRFILWKLENGNCPANLGMEHLYYLLTDDYVFVRKIEMPVSQKLIQVLDKYFVYDNQTLKLLPNGGWEYDGYKGYVYNPTFMRELLKLCELTCSKSVIDAGCGCGMYVAGLRRSGIEAVGFDANPYTCELSSRLLLTDEESCTQGDLTDKSFEYKKKANLVICKDTLPYIPKSDIKVAIRNLAAMAERYILVSWYEEGFQSSLPIHTYKKEYIVHLLEEVGFIPCELANNHIAGIINMEQNPACVFMRCTI